LVRHKEHKSVKKYICSGALYGCAAWIVYGTVELALSAGIQLLQNPEMVLLGWQWRLIAMVFGVYAGVGLILGAAFGAIIAVAGVAPSPWNVESAASLTVLLAFGANLVSAWPLARSEQIALALTVLLGIAIAASLFSKNLHQRVLGLSGPFAVALLLLSIPWVSREALGANYSSGLRTALALFVAATLALLARFKRHRQGGRTPSALAHAAFALLLLTAFSAAAAVRHRPPAMHPDTSTANATNKPNVVLVTMDTVRADHTSLYGYSRDTTPKLVELASTATLYTRAIGASDYTFPTHAAIFSGLYPDFQGAVWADVLPGNITTLADVLRSKGYWTAECVANYGMLGPQEGLAKGFAASDWRRAVPLSTADSVIANRRHPYYLREAAIRILGTAVNVDYFVRYTRNAPDINQCASGVLDEAAQRSAAFFLFVNYMDAHAPYTPDAPFDSRFPGVDRRFRAASYRRVKEEVNAGKRRLQPWEKTHLVSQYDAGISEVDWAVGGLLEKLRTLGLFENTIVIVTSDHGEAFGERGLLEHKVNNLNQELISVPLIVKYPDQHDARRSNQLLSQVDLMPTVLDVLHIAPPAPMEGRSLLTAAPDATDVFSETAGYGNRRAIISGSLKLISSKPSGFELYDLASDPDEQRNLYSSDNPATAELTKKLDAWVAARPRQKGPQKKLDPASVERLKSLGYVQ
jgi:arylsulfatase A-like enzyme